MPKAPAPITVELEESPTEKRVDKRKAVSEGPAPFIKAFNSAERALLGTWQVTAYEKGSYGSGKVTFIQTTIGKALHLLGNWHWDAQRRGCQPTHGPSKPLNGRVKSQFFGMVFVRRKNGPRRTYGTFHVGGSETESSALAGCTSPRLMGSNISESTPVPVQC